MGPNGNFTVLNCERVLGSNIRKPFVSFNLGSVSFLSNILMYGFRN